MTVSAQTATTNLVYSGSGAYAFTFKVTADDDITVLYTDTNGVVQTLGLSTDYTVVLSDDGDSGGTVTTVTPTDTDGVLTVYRNMPVTQDTEYVNSGPLDLEQLEDDFDKVVLILQQFKSLLDAELVIADWLGDWVTLTSYQVRDVVTAPSGSVYVCVVAHTAGTFATDLSNGYWRLVADIAAATAAQAAAEAAQTAAETAETAAEAARDRAEAAVDPDTHQIRGYGSVSVDASTQPYIDIHGNGEASNLLINPEFTVNQEDYAADGTATLAANTYGHDMWMNVTGSTQVYRVYASGSVDLGSMWVGQKNNDVLAADGETVTFSITNGAVEIYGIGTTSWTTVTPSTPHTFILSATQNGGWFYIRKHGSETFKRPKLERNVHSTSFRARPGTIEEQLCLAYYWRPQTLTLQGHASAASQEFAHSLAFPVPMVSAPTPVVVGTPVYTNSASLDIRGTNRFNTLLTAVSTAAATDCNVFFNGTTNYIEFDSRY